MSSVNRWAIYCHFFGVAVNHRFFLSIRATKIRRISAKMNTIYCHFSRPCEVKKRPFQSADKTNDPRKFTGDKLWITEVRIFIQVSHLYLRAPSGRACPPHPNAADRLEGTMLSVCPPASSPPSKGCGPCAASRLSHE